MVDDHKRQQEEGYKHLREAHEYAEWSHKDRQKRLPKLTPEQEQQMIQYLQMVGEHGWDKSIDLNRSNNGKEAEDCEGCPVFGMAKKAKQALKGQQSTTE